MADDRLGHRPLRRLRRASVHGRPGGHRRPRGHLRSGDGFFQAAAFAGLPNLVPDEELTNANSLLQTVETLAWMIGPIVGALMYTAWGPDVPYVVNALTFLVSVALIAGISERKLRSEESLTRGHWRDVADGLRLVVAAPPLRTVLIVWNVVLLGSAAINVAEVFFAKERSTRGDVGFGVIVAASGVGLALGSYLAAPSLGKRGLRRNYAGSIALMGAGWGRRRLRDLDLDRSPVHRCGCSGQRRGDRVQSAPRPAGGARPLPGPRARDHHELELRGARARDGRGGTSHERVRRPLGLAHGRWGLRRGRGGRTVHDALAAGRRRRAGASRRSGGGGGRECARRRSEREAS